MGEFRPSRNWNTRVELVLTKCAYGCVISTLPRAGPLMAVSIAVDKVQR